MLSTSKSTEHSLSFKWYSTLSCWTEGYKSVLHSQDSAASATLKWWKLIVYFLSYVSSSLCSMPSSDYTRKLICVVVVILEKIRPLFSVDPCGKDARPNSRVCVRSVASCCDAHSLYHIIEQYVTLQTSVMSCSFLVFCCLALWHVWNVIITDLLSLPQCPEVIPSIF